MNLKFFRYFMVLFLLLGTLIFSSGYVNGATAGCYLSNANCDSQYSLSYCNAQAAQIPGTRCVEYDDNNPNFACATGEQTLNIGVIDECIYGCCCRISQAGPTGEPEVKGLCTTGDFRGVIVDDCHFECNKNGVAYYNITGHVTVEGESLSGVNVSVDATSVLTDIDGNYTLPNIAGNHYYTIIAKYKSGCSKTTESIWLSKNTEENISVSCNKYSISGKVLNANGTGISAGIQETTTNTINQSDADGNYNLEGIFQGTNVYIVATDGDSCKGYLNIPSISSNQNQNIHISCNKWTINGTVYDNNRKIPDPTVSINIPGFSGKTNYYGFYEIVDVPEATTNTLTISATSVETINSETKRTCSGQISNITLTEYHPVFCNPNV